MKLPRTKHDLKWLQALLAVVVEEMERGPEGPWARDLGLVEFCVFWMDESAEVLWG